MDLYNDDAVNGKAEITMDSSNASRDEEMISKRRKEVFGDCALIEIIHLHDCLRGALKALEADVNALEGIVSENIVCEKDGSPGDQTTTTSKNVADLERRVAGRFKVIWSVFKSHSQAEDEFIWPALKTKTQGKVNGSPKYNPVADTNNNDVAATTTVSRNSSEEAKIEQAEYEEDHENEERMFSEIDSLLTKLRHALVKQKQENETNRLKCVVQDTAKNLSKHTRDLSKHLMVHLEKEETQCMPLVVKHLSKEEIHDLVGSIMGKRSADMIVQIMTMAVQNLDKSDREEMVKYMKESMAGTFFDRWLSMSGFGGTGPQTNSQDDRKRPAEVKTDETNINKRSKPESESTEQNLVAAVATKETEKLQAQDGASLTSQAELEKLIRAIATNPSLSNEQKNTTIQGLRDSVWKSNQRQKEMGHYSTVSSCKSGFATATATAPPIILPSSPSAAEASHASSASSTGCSRTRRVTPPSMYFRKNDEGKIDLVWSSDTPCAPPNASVPLFSAAELAPTYHDGATGAVLGCPHYARACKLRHPKSGRLYTCRLCCAQQKEMPMKDQDEPLDRYAVTEVMCMKCTTLQPAEDRCINADCESRGKPFAKYFCRICHLYDDGSRPIFHCPYCNTCRLGLGLGIDFRHCMRCNACVSLSDTDHHCISQKLQGSCPICHESLFQSTDPLRGLKCGHVMHLSCFTEYRRGHAYTCPLCMRSMEDMSDYFAMLDTAVRMQPMPAAYLNTMSNIYCQDCCETGQTRYHFVGQKCPHCNSYNTRELGRVHTSPRSSPRNG